MRRQRARTAPTGWTSSSVVAMALIPASPGDGQAVADAAHRLQVEGVRGIGLDLAPQAVDLHVDGAVAGGGGPPRGALPRGGGGRGGGGEWPGAGAAGRGGGGGCARAR